MVFGVFDGLHEGHQFFLTEAKKRCGELVVVVAQDGAVERLKSKKPKRALAERVHAIQAFDPSLIVVSGDEREGEWKALRERVPDVIFLGYDQAALAAALDELGIEHEAIAPYEPERFKSGILDG